MAKIQRYQSPPNWPAPPPDWTPPPGWQPDPAWGPAPEGWQFWRAERANPNAWGRAFAVGGILIVVFWLIGLVAASALGGGTTVNGSARAFGAIAFRGLLASAIAGAIAYNSGSRWRWWTYALAVFGFNLLINLVSMAGRLGS